MSDKKFLFYTFLFSGLLLFAFNIQPIIYFATSNVVPGWDGASHQALGELYSKNIFPSVWGWASQWYLGMPFPQFYPPAFYFFVALFAHLFFWIPYDIIFRTFVLTTFFIVPGAIAWCGLRLSQDREVAFLSALLSTLFLSYYNNEIGYGVNALSTLNTGLFANTLGFLFLVAWVRSFFNDPEMSTKRMGSAIWLSLIFLSDVHLVFPAIILLIVRFRFDMGDAAVLQDYTLLKKIIFNYFLYALLSLGMTSFWLLPMFVHYDYFSSVVMPITKNDWIHILILFFYLPSLVAGGLYMGVIKKQRPIVILSTGIIILYFVVAIGSLIFSLGCSLPFHFIRWFSSILYLSPIIYAYFLVHLLRHRINKWCGLILFSMLIIISINQINVPYEDKLPGIYFNADIECFDQLIHYMKSIPPGLVLVEADYNNSTPRQFAIDARLGINSVRTIFSNIRESAMSGLYLVPVRNLFSKDLESWGVTSFLSRERSFIYKISIKKKLAIAHYFGVRYIIASSEGTLDMLKKSKSIHMLNSIGPFKIFDIGPTPPTNEIKQLKTAPIALFAPLGLHHRKINDLSFSRFSEEWLKNFDPNIVYVMPKTLSLEHNPVFDFSGNAVLISYTYKNLNSALDELERFSTKGTLIIFDHKDELCNTLKERHIKNIIYMPVPDEDHPLPSLYVDVQNILKNKILLQKQQMPDQITPHLLLIKQSYFPEWKAVDGSALYLASPSFIMAVSGNDHIKINFTTPFSVYISYAISLLSLLLVIGLTKL